ncbi:hypothetical protein Tco_0356508 [Tanacetum coccineum]
MVFRSFNADYLRGVGSTSGIRACALRNFDLEKNGVRKFSEQKIHLAKLPMLKLGEYEMWEIRIKQYFQIQDYALWEVKRTAAANNDDKNLAFLTTSSPSILILLILLTLDDATVYAFLSTQPQGSQLVHEDLEQLHDDDLEEMDLKWNMALLSMRARKFYQRTGRKKKNYHLWKQAPRSKDNRNWNQGSSSKAVRIEDASEKAMCAIDGAGFDWSDMAEDEEIALLKRSVGHKEYLMGLLKTELEKVKEENENNDAPIIEDWVSDDEEEVEPIPKVEKKTAIPTATKKESVKTEKPIRRTVVAEK